MANALLANAPIREINKSSFGMAIAKTANRENNKHLLTRSIKFTCYNNNYCTKDGQFVIFILFTKYFTQQYSHWWFQEVHWYIELHQISDKDSIGEVEFCYVVYPRGGRVTEAQLITVMHPVTDKHTHTHQLTHCASVYPSVS